MKDLEGFVKDSRGVDWLSTLLSHIVRSANKLKLFVSGCPCIRRRRRRCYRIKCKRSSDIVVGSLERDRRQRSQKRIRRCKRRDRPPIGERTGPDRTVFISCKLAPSSPFVFLLVDRAKGFQRSVKGLKQRRQQQPLQQQQQKQSATADRPSNRWLVEGRRCYTKY